MAGSNEVNNSTPNETDNGSSKTNNDQNRKVKTIPANLKIPPKKPKLTKAERRALQEKQRAAKAAGGNKQNQAKKSNKNEKSSSTSNEISSNVSEKRDRSGSSASITYDYGNGSDKTLQMFAHLPQYQDRSGESHLSGVVLNSSDKSLKVKLHPAVFDLGIKFENGSIRGANARCRAMMETFKIVIQDYVPPEVKNNNNTNTKSRTDLPTLLDQQVIKPSFQHWTTHCRIHSITMGNAVNFLKIAIANLSRNVTLSSAKQIICQHIDAYVQERINFADKIITKHALSKIKDNDVILVYGRSEVIQIIMLAAAAKNKQFRVIVADSRPLLEGRNMLKILIQNKIPCTYILLNSLSYVMMRDVTKVFLGAAALKSDGSVLSRVGTATVALMAKSNNIPVLFCCETYKISNRVQLESFTSNELGNPNDVASFHTQNQYVDMDLFQAHDNDSNSAKNSLIQNTEQQQHLKLLNLIYDLTPSEFVSGIITELGILPSTSVAVLLREMNLHNTDI